MKSLVKTIMISLSAVLLFAATTQADILCISKDIPVEKGKIQLKGNLKVVRKKKCPQGFVVALDINKYIEQKVDKVALNGYKKLEELNEDLKSKANASDVAKALANKADVSALANKADRTELEKYAPVTAYAKTESMDQAFSAKADVADLNNKVDKVAQPIQPGETLTGISYYGGLVIMSGVAPHQLDSTAIGTAEECTGSAKNPTAPAGKICAYSSHPNKYIKVYVEPFLIKDELTTEEKCTAKGGEWKPAACVIPYDYTHDDNTYIQECEDFYHGVYDQYGRCTTDKDEVDCVERCSWEPEATWEEITGLCMCRGQEDMTVLNEQACLEKNLLRYEEGQCSISDGIYSNQMFLLHLDNGSTTQYLKGHYIIVWAYTAPDAE